MKDSKLDNDIKNIDNSIKKFEISLRTKLQNTTVNNKYNAIRQLEYEANNLRDKVNKILNTSTTNTVHRFMISAVNERAMSLLNIHHNVKYNGVMEGDLIKRNAEIGSKKSK